MKRKEKLMALLAALAVIVCATFAATKLNGETQELEIEEDSSVSVYILKEESLANITWTWEGEMISLDYLDDVWSYSGDSAFPLDTSYADNMVYGLTDLTASKKIENPEDVSQYGLEDPVCMVLVTLDDGTYTQLLIGDETGIGGERYLSNGDGSVYLVNEGFLDYFSYRLYDLVEKESIPTMTSISGFHVAADTGSYHISYQEDSGYVWVGTDGGEALALDGELTEALIGNISDLVWGECVAYNADAVDIASYGLEDPAATVTVNYTETVSVATGEKDDSGNLIYEDREETAEFVLELGAYTDDSCYARIKGSEMIYLVDASVCEALQQVTYEKLKSNETA